jgi:hypothetical protein
MTYPSNTTLLTTAPNSTPDSLPLSEPARVGAPPPSVVVSAFVSAPILLPDTIAASAICPLPSPPDSAAPVSCDTRSALWLARSPESSCAAPSTDFSGCYSDTFRDAVVSPGRPSAR